MNEGQRLYSQGRAESGFGRGWPDPGAITVNPYQYPTLQRKKANLGGRRRDWNLVDMAGN